MLSLKKMTMAYSHIQLVLKNRVTLIEVSPKCHQNITIKIHLSPHEKVNSIQFSHKSNVTNVSPEKGDCHRE